MKEIIFPGFNLSLKINRIAISIAGINIYWYAILIVMAFCIALILCKKDNGKYNIFFDTILDMSIIVIPIAIKRK